MSPPACKVSFMREIDLRAKESTLTQTFMGYGNTGSGKTQWVATMPRVLFLSDVTEHGWETVKNMDPNLFFEPEVEPIVWGIEQMNDMATAIARATPLIAEGRIRTVCIDSLSFYADLYLNALIGMQTKYDARSAYGSLGNHLRDLRVKVHSLNTNVFWTALAKHPETETDEAGRVTGSTPGSPLIPGQQADKFSAGVQMLFYFRKDIRGNAQQKVPASYEIHTQPFQKYIARNRLGERANDLPSPMTGTYSDYLRLIGYDPDAVRAGLVPLNNLSAPIKINTAPPKPATPPITIKTTPRVTVAK